MELNCIIIHIILEFQKYDGEYLLDMIKNNTSKLGFELDVHWIQRAGVNPVEFVKNMQVVFHYYI